MKKFFDVLGITQSSVSHTEKIVSAVGGFVSVFCVYSLNHWFLGTYGAAIVVASIGASAVLLFVVPHGQLSQPWAVLGGHLVSAVIGVTCAKLFLEVNIILAASLAVGLAIGAMYYLSCIHPPGGATALSAVIGGSSVHELGYQFVLTPVAISVLLILLVAVVFNYLFHWRRYPAFLYKKALAENQASTASGASSNIVHEEFENALREIDSFIDISEHDLLRIYDIVARNMQRQDLTAESIKVGGFYSNGEMGDEWSVRKVVDASSGKKPEEALVIYKVVAGKDRRSSGYSTRSEFLKWARHQVVQDEEKWRRFAEEDKES